MGSVNLFASMAVGYRININETNWIRMRFIAEETMPEYLARSDGLFFDILLWIAHNKNHFENAVDDVTIYISYRRNNINEGSTGIGLDVGDRFYMSLDYTNNVELKNNIFYLIQLYYDFTADNNTDNQLGLYFVWEQDTSILGYRTGVFEQEEYTDIFIGPFPGLMFNYPGFRRGVVFWGLEKANSYLNKYIDENYYLEYIILTRNNIYNIFGELD